MTDFEVNLNSVRVGDIYFLTPSPETATEPETPNFPTPAETAPVISPFQPTHEDTLSPEDTLALLKDILGNDVPIAAADIPRLTKEVNIAIGRTSRQSVFYWLFPTQTFIPRSTEQKIKTDELLKDYLRVSLLGILSHTEGIEPDPLASPIREENVSLENLDNLASLALADGVLPTYMLEDLKSGHMRIKVRFTTDRHGEVDNFRLILQSGWHEEVIAEYKNGTITKGNPPESPVARAAIIYLQRLLIGNGANQYTFRKVGVFDKKTFDVLRGFMNQKNLVAADFNSDTMSRILGQRISEADEAYRKFQLAPTVDMQKLDDVLEKRQKLLEIQQEIETKYHITIHTFDDNQTRWHLVEAADKQKFMDARRIYQENLAALGGNEGLTTALTNANLRYELAKESIRSMLAVVEQFSQFRDIQSENLSDGDKAFIKACKDAIDKYRPIISTIFKEILNGENGLILIDLRSYRNNLRKYKNAQEKADSHPIKADSDLTAENQRKALDEAAEYQRKALEALDNFSDVAYRMLSTLRGWEAAAEHDPQLYQIIEADIKRVTDRIRGEISSDFPPAQRLHLQEQVQFIDQRVMTKIEGERSDESLTLQQLEARFSRAAAISEKLETGPERGVILSFIRELLRGRNLADAEKLFSNFKSILSQEPSALESVIRTYYQNSPRQATGFSGVSPNSSNAQDLSDETVLRNLGDREKGRVYNLAITLYSLMEQHNLHAEQRLTFAQLIQQAQKLLNDLEGMPNNEMLAVLGVLSKTSDNKEIAREELAQQMQDQVNRLTHKDFRQLNGGQELVITPRTIHELEKGFVQATALNGIVSYEDIQKWGEKNTWVQAHKPAGARAGEYFFVSKLGIYRVPPELVDELPKIPVNNLAGTRFSREPTEFISNEKIATLKLAMSRYVPVSDEDILMFSGDVTARLTALDLAGPDPNDTENPGGIIKVFGEGKHWLMPGFYQLNPLEIAALKKLAATIESNTLIALASPNASQIVDLLKKLASGESSIQLTRDEKQLLEAFLAGIPSISAYVNQFTNLDEVEKPALAKALLKLKVARSRLIHKNGLGEADQYIIRELAKYLSWDESLAIYDARLTGDEEYLDVLVAKLKEIAARDGKVFDEGRFRDLYNKTIEILSQVHGELKVLASKYPPEEGIQKGLLAFWNDPGLSSFRELWTGQLGEIGHHALLTVNAPSPSDFLMAGVANDMVFEMNVILFSKPGENNDIVDELGNINTEIKELEQELQIENAEQIADSRLVQEIRDCQALFPDLLFPLATQLPGRLEQSDPRKALAEEFLGLAENLKNPAALPSDFGTKIMDLLRRIGEAKSSETNQDKKRSLEKLENAIQVIVEGLRKNDAAKYKIYLAKALIQFIQGFTYPETPEKNGLIRGYIDDFVKLADNLLSDNENPSAYLRDANTFIEMAELLRSQVERAVTVEQDANKKAAMESILISTGKIKQELGELITERNRVFPGFQRKLNLEIRRQEIFEILSSDRFDQEKFLLLRDKFQGVLGEQAWDAEILDFVAGIFNSDTGEVIGPDGRNTHMTIAEVLTKFFDTNKDGVVDERDEARAINLSSLLPEPGEDPDVTTAKIALSKFFEKLQPQQLLDLLKTIPTMAGAGHGVSALLSLGSRAFGGADIPYGPSTPDELLDINSPWHRAGNSFVSFMALSSSRRPQMNLSSQVYMLMAGTAKGQEYLEKVLGESAGTFNFDHVDKEAMEAFFVYFKEEVLPHLDNPRLVQRIEYLRKHKLIPLDLEQIRDYNLPSLPDGDFKIYDSYNAPDDMKGLSRFLESVLKIVGELNQSRSVEDIENYPITFFDPLESLRESNPHYQEPGVESPKEIPVIRYGPDPGVGDVDDAWEVEMWLEDVKDWIDMYGEDALIGMAEAAINDPVKFLADAAKGGGAFAFFFAKFMGKQIGMGFNDTWGGLGDLLNAAISGEKDKALQAVDRILRGLAETTGAFSVYEFLMPIFYMDVINELKADDPAKAFGKFTAITLMFYKSMGASIDIIKGLLKSGEAVFDGGKLLIKTRSLKAAARAYEARMAEAQRLIGHRVGFKLLWYQLNPFVLPYRIIKGGVKAYRYTRGGLSVEVTHAPAQVEVTRQVTEDPSKWTKIADFGVRARAQVGIQHGAFWRNLKGGFGLFRGMADVVSSSKTGKFAALDAANDLLLAKMEPGHRFTFAFSKNGVKLGPVTFKGQTYLNLVKAAANNDYQTFRQIIRRHNLYSATPYKGGSIEQLFNLFKAPAEIYKLPAIQAQLGQITPQGPVFDEIKFLRRASLAIGRADNLAEKYTFHIAEIDPQTGKPRINPETGQPIIKKSVELTGRQVTEILYNNFIKHGKNPIVSAEVDAQVVRQFSESVNQKYLFKRVQLIGKRYVERWWRHKFADNLYIKGQLNRGWIKRLFHAFGDYGEAAIPSEGSIYERLGKNNPLVESYAAKHGLTPQQARAKLSLELYEKYINDRAKLVQEILDQGAKEHLTPEQYAKYEKQGGVLRRGLFFRRNYQQVFNQVKNKIKNALAEFDARFSVQAETETLLKNAGVANPPQVPFETRIRMETGARVKLNGAFDGVSPELQNRFLEAVRKARAQGKAGKIVIEKGVRLANGGEAALNEIINRLESGNVSRKVTITAKDGTIYIKGKIRLSSSGPTLMVTRPERSPDVKLGVNGSEPPPPKSVPAEEAAPPAPVAPQLPPGVFTPEQLTQARELLQKMGFSKVEADGVANRQAFLEKVGQKLGERLPDYIRELQRTNPQRYAEFLEFVAQPTRGQRAAITGINLVTGILSFFMVEEILNILGLENEGARFTLLIGGSHAVNMATASWVNTAVRGQTAVAIERGLTNVSWAKKITQGGGNLLSGVGYAILASNIYNGILDDCEVGPNHWMRGEFAQFAVGMGVPTLVGWGGKALLTSRFGEAVAIRLVSRTAVKEAGALTAGRFLVKGFGRALWILAVAEIGFMIPNFFISHYKQSVNARAREIAIGEMKDIDTSGAWYEIIGETLESAMGYTDEGLSYVFGNRSYMANSDENMTAVAMQDAVQIGQAMPGIINVLRQMWIEEDLSKYDGSAQRISFFSGMELPTGRIAELLSKEITFNDGLPIMGYRTEQTQWCDVDVKPICFTNNIRVPIYGQGPEELRASAYAFLKEKWSKGEEIPDLEDILRDRFKIAENDTNAFMELASLKFLQEQIAYIVSLEPETIVSTSYLTGDNRKLREYFDRNGRLKPGKAGELVGWLINMQAQSSGMDAGTEWDIQMKVVAETRKVARLQALMSGERTYTQVDIDLGLVNADGSINKNSDTHKRYMGALSISIPDIFAAASEEEPEEVAAADAEVEHFDPNDYIYDPEFDSIADPYFLSDNADIIT